MSIRTQADALAAALVAGVGTTLAVTQDLAPNAPLPAVVIGPPDLQFDGPCAGPSGALFPVAIVVDHSERSWEQLYDLVPPVEAVIYASRIGVVLRAQPGPFAYGGSNMPAYYLDVQVGL